MSIRQPRAAPFGKQQSLPRVAILLGTYHGQQFLVDQLDSIAAQSHTNWQVWASDDNSQDNTHAILEEYRANWGGALSVMSGPSEGFATNFLMLVCNASIQADYFAFCDQDDIWEPGKLTRAIEWLRTIPNEIPALYCSRTRLVDNENRDIGLSPLFIKSASFANALVQNIGGGNTMVFNQAARNILCEAGSSVEVVSHDWWTYLLVTGCGGKVFYDPVPSIRYRQHQENLVGHNSNLFARWKRICMLVRGRYKKWNNINLKALKLVYANLTPENKEIYNKFSSARNSWVIPRILGLAISGVYRQSLLDNVALAIAAFLGKV